MYKIKTLNKISENGLTALKDGMFEISGNCDSPAGIIVRSASMHDAEMPPSLLAIARAGAGVNNIPVDKCSEKGIAVFNTPGANANAVKELAVAAIMLTGRKVMEGINWAAGLSGAAEGVAKTVESGKGAYAGQEAFGKTLGVVGLGAIGVLISNAAIHLGMDVLGYDPFMSVESAWNISRGVRKAKSLDEIYAESDYISLHLPYNKETKGAVNAESIAKMKEGVRLINLARAELVNAADIKAALESGKMACYVTDFPTEDTVGVRGIINIPHLGASTYESEENCAVMAAQEMREFLLFGNIKNSVNFPNCELPESGAPRIAITHKNSPGVIGAITTALGNKGVNVENMVNRSKGDYAYTLLEAGAFPGGMEAELSGVKDIIRARLIPPVIQ